MYDDESDESEEDEVAIEDLSPTSRRASQI